MAPAAAAAAAHRPATSRQHQQVCIYVYTSLTFGRACFQRGVFRYIVVVVVVVWASGREYICAEGRAEASRPRALAKVAAAPHNSPRGCCWGLHYATCVCNPDAAHASLSYTCIRCTFMLYYAHYPAHMPNQLGDVLSRVFHEPSIILFF